MQKLATKIVDKPWGKRGIDPRYGVDADRQVGEIWFEPPPDRELDVMAKYLFTTERLSIQVHPDNATARARGYPRGKDECWIVLDVDDDAELGIGTVREVDPKALMDAAKDGSIVELIDWRRPSKGWRPRSSSPPIPSTTRRGARSGSFSDWAPIRCCFPMAPMKPSTCSAVPTWTPATRW